MSNLHIGELLDKAYDVAKTTFLAKEFNFSELGSKTGKVASNFKKENVEDGIGIFYTELLLDPRFITYSNNTGRLKEFIDYSDFIKRNNLIYSDDFVFDEDSDKAVVSSETEENEAVDENIDELIDSKI